MSRLTGSDALGLFEAYKAVYVPQELTEEQVWEEVENWVNSLLEEGYDLSDYTWEEMYEEYLSEMGQRPTTGQMTAPKAAPRPTSRPQVAGGGMGGMRGSGRDRNAYQTSSSPGALRVPAPSAPAKPTAAPTKPAATAPTKTTAAPAKPAAAPARPAAAAKPAATPSTTPKPTAASTPRPKDTSITDMIGRSQVRQGAPINTGNASSDARAIAGRASVGAGPTSSAAKPSPSPVNRATGSKKPGSIVSSFDLFDVVMGHLLDEGYADTEESALAIMANMSEEWRESILEDVPAEVIISRAATSATSATKKKKRPRSVTSITPSREGSARFRELVRGTRTSN